MVTTLRDDSFIIFLNDEIDNPQPSPCLYQSGEGSEIRWRRGESTTTFLKV